MSAIYILITVIINVIIALCYHYVPILLPLQYSVIILVGIILFSMKLNNFFINKFSLNLEYNQEQIEHQKTQSKLQDQILENEKLSKDIKNLEQDLIRRDAYINELSQSFISIKDCPLETDRLKILIKIIDINKNVQLNNLEQKKDFNSHLDHNKNEDVFTSAIKKIIDLRIKTNND